MCQTVSSPRKDSRPTPGKWCAVPNCEFILPSQTRARCKRGVGITPPSVAYWPASGRLSRNCPGARGGTMRRCDPQSGAQFAGLFSETGESAFVKHLEACSDCRAAVEAVAG